MASSRDSPFFQAQFTKIANSVILIGNGRKGTIEIQLPAIDEQNPPRIDQQARKFLNFMFVSRSSKERREKIISTSSVRGSIQRRWAARWRGSHRRRWQEQNLNHQNIYFPHSSNDNLIRSSIGFDSFSVVSVTRNSNPKPNPEGKFVKSIFAGETSTCFESSFA